jgi:hypothetical protein
MDPNDIQNSVNSVDEIMKAGISSDYEQGIPKAIIKGGPVRYAGFWMRFWAYLLDLLVVGSIERILIKPLFRVLDLPLAQFNMFAPISIASAVIFYDDKIFKSNTWKNGLWVKSNRFKK